MRPQRLMAAMHLGAEMFCKTILLFFITGFFLISDYGTTVVEVIFIFTTYFYFIFWIGYPFYRWVYGE